MSLNASHEIFLILNDNSMSSKNKVFCILAIIKAEVCEKYEILQPEKVQQQILSEILYLYEKNENRKVNVGWINTRLRFLIRTLADLHYIVIRTAYEVGIDFLDKLSSSPLPDPPNTARKYEKSSGWHQKTYRRFERYCLFNRKSRTENTRPREFKRPKLLVFIK